MEKVCDAHAGMWCKKVFRQYTVELDVMFRAIHQLWAFWLLLNLMLQLRDPLSHKLACNWSCDKLGIGGKKENTQGIKAAPAVLSEALQSKSTRGIRLHPAPFSLAPEGMCGSREGLMDGRVVPCCLSLPLAIYLESLLMTRISAPFSSLRRWLSALKSTRT